MKPLKPWEQALLFQFVFEGKSLPAWAGSGPNPQVAVFARLMNKSERWAKAAYERAMRGGYMDKSI